MASNVKTPDALSKLPDFEWRGVLYPVLSAHFGRRYETTDQKESFGKFQFIDMLGPTNWIFDYTLGMRNGISVESKYGKDLFGKIIQLEKDCANRERGDLVDPIWGLWECVALSFEGDIEALRRDGVDVKVSFKYKPEIDDTRDVSGAGILSVGQLYSEAKDLDAALALVKWKRPEDAPGATADLLGAISGFGARIQRAGDKIAAGLERYAEQMHKIDRQLSALKDPANASVRRSVRHCFTSAKRLTKNISDTQRQTKQIVIRHTKDVLAIAKDGGMTIQELLKLNPGLSATPMVPQGTKARLYG
jgi:hypothetical protein